METFFILSSSVTIHTIMAQNGLSCWCAVKKLLTRSL